MKAYVLVKTEMAMTAEALTLIRKANGVVGAEVTFGPYDMVVQIEAENLEAIAKTIVWEIRTVPGIVDTMTCIAVHV